MKRVAAIIVAGGEGRRFGSPKQFALIKGKAVLDWSVEKFESHALIREIVLVLPDERGKEQYFSRYKKVTAAVRGGARRQDSVWNGLSCLDRQGAEVILVHDAVRPLVRAEVITRVIQEAEKSGAAIPAIPVGETVKEAAGGRVVRTLEREKLFRVQTPQGFSYGLLVKAMRQAREEHFYGTDEATLVERIGGRVTIVEGDPLNIKITTPADLKIAEVWIES